MLFRDEARLGLITVSRATQASAGRIACVCRTSDSHVGVGNKNKSEPRPVTPEGPWRTRQTRLPGRFTAQILRFVNYVCGEGHSERTITFLNIGRSILLRVPPSPVSRIPGNNTTNPLYPRLNGVSHYLHHIIITQKNQNLVEKITRAKIYDAPYWKEKCFGVSAESLVDLATDLTMFGGIFGANNKACDFLCLTLKMLQIQPEREIVLEFIKNEEYKYVRALGAFYLRLTGKPLEIYQYLEPLLNDYRMLRYNSPQGKFSVRHVDEFIHDLLSKDYMCDIALPRIPHRQVLETAGQIEPRLSLLEDEEEEGDEDAEGDDDADDADKKDKRRAREESDEPGESQPEKRQKA